MDKGRNLEEVGNLRRVGDWSYYSLHRRENEGMYTSRYRTYRYITSGRRDPFLEREGMYTASIWYMWYMCIHSLHGITMAALSCIWNGDPIPSHPDSGHYGHYQFVIVRTNPYRQVETRGGKATSFNTFIPIVSIFSIEPLVRNSALHTPPFLQLRGATRYLHAEGGRKSKNKNTINSTHQSKVGNMLPAVALWLRARLF